MKGIMIDIETMGTHTSLSLLLSIGAIAFEMSKDGPVMDVRVLEKVYLWESQILAGRRIEPGTQKWWSEQSEEARAHWEKAESKENISYLDLHIGNYYAECGLTPKTDVWANGVVFDIGNLENILHTYEKKIPWSYNAVRDARTIYSLPKLRQMPDGMTFVGHNPVEDCRKQIWRLWEHMPEEMLV